MKYFYLKISILERLNSFKEQHRKEVLYYTPEQQNILAHRKTY
jgi:hypothetical protein